MFSVRTYKSGDELYVADAHQRIYADEYNWGDEFSSYASKIALDFASRSHGSGEEMWIAESEGTPIGSVMLCSTDDISVGQLRLFLVEKTFRNKGVGTSLLSALMQKAKNHGYKELVLWTASPLTSAIRQYEKLGFHETRRIENRTWCLDGSIIYEIEMVCSL